MAFDPTKPGIEAWKSALQTPSGSCALPSRPLVTTGGFQKGLRIYTKREFSRVAFRGFGILYSSVCNTCLFQV